MRVADETWHGGGRDEMSVFEKMDVRNVRNEIMKLHYARSIE